MSDKEASEEGSHVAIWWKSDVSRGTNMYRGPEADTQLMHVRQIKEASMARIGEVRGIIREESGGFLNHGSQLNNVSSRC